MKNSSTNDISLLSDEMEVALIRMSGIVYPYQIFMLYVSLEQASTITVKYSVL
jgi:hypothetical protein